MAYAAIAIRVALAVVLLLAAVAKLPRQRAFTDAVRRYELLPRAASELVARLLPPFELACGFLLLVGFATPVVATLVAATLAVFAGAVAINLLRGRVIDCGCFSGAAPRRITWRIVARNIALAAGAGLVVAEAPRALALDRLAFGGRATIGDAEALAVALTAALALAVTALGNAAFVWRRRRVNWERAAQSA